MEYKTSESGSGTPVYKKNGNEIVCDLTRGTFSLIGKEGKLENLLPVIITDEKRDRRDIDTAAIDKEAAAIIGRRVFIPEPVTDTVPEKISDKFFEGISVKTVFTSPGINGKIFGKVLIAFPTFELGNNPYIDEGIRDIIENNSFIISVEITGYSDFTEPPSLYGICPLFAGRFSAWKIQEGYIQNPKAVTFFKNGYQSWSSARTLFYGDKTRKIPIKSADIILNDTDYGINTRYRSEYCTAITDTVSGSSVIFGFLDNRKTINVFFMERFGNGGNFTFFSALCRTDGLGLGILDIPYSVSPLMVILPPKDFGVYGLKAWATASGIYSGARLPRVSDKNGTALSATAGWCSWYYYYLNINEKEMLKNLEILDARKDITPEIFQLDDGYMEAVGDFTKINRKFPSGLKFLAEKIREKGKVPGIWIAPFFVLDKSETFKNHPDWILRDKKGKPICVGKNWGGKLYALDLTDSRVRKHLENLIEKIVTEWGFEFIKIDFIYAAEIFGAVYSSHGKTRAEVFRSGVELIRKVMGDNTLLLGCGAPFGPCTGLVDIMRIGVDTAARWHILGDRLWKWIRKKFDADLIGLGPALLCTVNRSFMHGALWINDPDCLVVRKRKSRLNKNEVRLQLTVFGLSGGQIFFSDDLSILDEEGFSMMKLMLPPMGNGALSPDMLKKDYPNLYGYCTDSSSGLKFNYAVMNFGRKKRKIRISIAELPGPGYYSRCCNGYFALFDFWKAYSGDDPFIGIYSGDSVLEVDVEPHGVKYLIGTEITPDEEGHPSEPILLGSTLHISGGTFDITEFGTEETDKRISFGIKLPGGRKGKVYILLPADFKISGCTGAESYKIINKSGFDILELEIVTVPGEMFRKVIINGK